MGVAAHVWTVMPLLRAYASPPVPPASAPWSHTFEDPRVGPVTLHGFLRRPEGSRHLMVLVHGLGGCADSRYLIAAAHQADAMGLASLRLHLRGADPDGDDLYHAGLGSDLSRVLESPALADFDAVSVFGYSLGGHLVLRFATEVVDPRVRAVAAACAPLDLAISQRMIDRARVLPYRRYLLRGMVEDYERAALRRALPTPAEVVARVRTIRDFDATAVVPRFGFRDPDHYYSEASAGPRLGDLRVPALLVAATGDPMVPEETIRPWVEPLPERLEMHWVRRGGHVSFAHDLDLGMGPRPGLPGQVMRWLVDRS